MEENNIIDADFNQKTKTEKDLGTGIVDFVDKYYTVILLSGFLMMGISITNNYKKFLVKNSSRNKEYLKGFMDGSNYIMSLRG